MSNQSQLYWVRIENPSDVRNTRQHNKPLTFNESQRLRDALIKTGKYSTSEIVVRAAYSSITFTFVEIVDLNKEI